MRPLNQLVNTSVLIIINYYSTTQNQLLMSCINFEKNNLINLQFSLDREFLLTNKKGTYCSSSIALCHTRKYHGLLVPYIESLRNSFVLLSTVHETIILDEVDFNLGINKYPFSYDPKGHKYMLNYENYPVPTITYKVNDLILTKSLILSNSSDTLYIKYSLGSKAPKATLKVKPFFAFRGIHELSKANHYANVNFRKTKNSIAYHLYDEFPEIHLSTSRKSEFVASPEWFYNVEYYQEQVRGYEFNEDLLAPGYFELNLKANDTLIFSVGLEEISYKALKRKAIAEINTEVHTEKFNQFLENSAKQFLVKRNGDYQVVSGYHWFEQRGRDTFVALPGLTLPQGKIKEFKNVMNSMVRDLKGGLFPNSGTAIDGYYGTVDTSLWYFWALQQYYLHTGDYEWVWKRHGKFMKNILNAYKNGTLLNIKMQENYLISAEENGRALTWMDAVISGKPVTSRGGMSVEINALWYNAVLFTLELASYYNEHEFVDEWYEIPVELANSILNNFWDSENQKICDYFNKDEKNWQVRPNQLILTSLPHRPLSDNINRIILDQVEKELLTPRGIRTLSPKDPEYIGVYRGNQHERDMAYHQGTVWPWLAGHFFEGYMNLHGENGCLKAETFLNNFQHEICYRGLGTVSEIYDGNAPHNPRGAISQAWSVAELNRLNHLIKFYRHNHKMPELIKLINNDQLISVI